MGKVEIARAVLAAEVAKRVLDHAQLRLIAELDDPHELALLLHIPLGAARRKLEQAAALDRLPVVAGLLRDGRIDLDRFEVVCKRTENLDAGQARAVDTGLTGAAEWTTQELKSETDRLICLVDPAGAERRHVRAVRKSSQVSYQSMPDGMALLTAYLDAVPARAIFDQITADAETLDDDRTWGEKQADVFLERMLGSGRPVTVHTDLTISAKTLIGLTEEPGHISGVGPVDAATAREIAAQGDWRKVLVDEVGMPIGVGRQRYRPPEALKEFVRVRDRVCQAPGCMRPAAQCEIDHARGFASGGVTDACNLGPFCALHHYLKTIGLYRFTRELDGTRHWTTPLGFVHTTRPKPIAEPDPP
ncbi:HNH endonuclease signature motif containing protein [Kutzneria viridogrisea]|uniref:HNH nuclease domain-containing protein n=1 Tax=Kutzneria viridogrisea TaxID=47990 RepID=A0ABR6BF30_9PSEU|nr:hypothetical protein [Kutzneria viridogrisea]